MKYTKEQIQEIKAEIEKTLNKSIPQECYSAVWYTKGFFGSEYINICIAANDTNINNVRGQHPQRINLVLELNELELQPSTLGGMGGQSIYRQIDPNNPKEKYLAMMNIKIPFRMPKKELKFIYPAIGRFAQNWTKAIKENKERLMYQDLCNNYEMF